MTVVASIPDSHTPDLLLSPTKALEYLKQRYGITISIKSFYSMISRSESPKVTYFRARPKFKIADIDEWARSNTSSRKRLSMAPHPKA